jgi:hypothetical protein
MDDGTALAEALLGTARVLGARGDRNRRRGGGEGGDGRWCGRLSGRATRAFEVHDRVEVVVRDPASFGRPTRLVWRKRRWRAGTGAAPAGPGPRRSSISAPRWCRRCGMMACRHELARPVTGVTGLFGVCWWPVMNAVV